MPGRGFRWIYAQELDGPRHQHDFSGGINFHLRFLYLHGRRLRQAPRSPHGDLGGSGYSSKSPGCTGRSHRENRRFFYFRSNSDSEIAEAIRVSRRYSHLVRVRLQVVRRLRQPSSSIPTRTQKFGFCIPGVDLKLMQSDQEIPLTGAQRGLVFSATSEGNIVHWPGVRPFNDPSVSLRLVGMMSQLTNLLWEKNIVRWLKKYDL